MNTTKIIFFKRTKAKMNIGGFCKRTGTCFGAKGLKQRHGKNRWRGGPTGIQWRR